MRTESLAAGILLLGLQACSADNEKPNIIFLMDDQHRWDALGVVNPTVRTPVLDKLAREGVFFRQAVCQAPMSIASRNSMMLGVYPNQIGTLRNEPGPTDEMLPTVPLAEMIRRAGYETAGFGKIHWGRTVGLRGFETRYEAECRETGAVMMEDVDPEKYHRYNDEVKDFGPGEENNAGYIGCVSALPENEHRDGWLTEKCIEYLRNREDDRPLFLYLSYYKPHAGHNVPEKYERMYDGVEIGYAVQPPWMEDCSPHAEGINRREMYVDFWKQATQEQWRLMTSRYYANCTWMDSMYGEVLDVLEAKGLLENALVVYLSDHGEMLGERYYRFNKYCLYESSIRVPMIFSGSALPERMRHRVDDRPAELVDVYTTLTKFAGCADSDILPGIDLLSDETRDAGFCALHERPTEAAFMWRTSCHKLILCMKRKPDASLYGYDDIIGGELYDLVQDPDEWCNKFSDPAYTSIKEQMTSELMEKIRSVGKLPSDGEPEP